MRSLIRRLFVFLLLGVVITVAVSLVGSVLPVLSHFLGTKLMRHGLVIDAQEPAAAWEVSIIESRLRMTVASFGRVPTEKQIESIGVFPGTLPYWSIINCSVRPMSSGSVRGWFAPYRYEITAGWPLSAFYGVAEFPLPAGRGGPTNLRWAARLPWTFMLDLCTFVPLRPLWRGACADAAFWAAASFSISSVARAVRSRRRIGRGLCPACAYPVGASPVCSECGGSVAPRQAQVPMASPPGNADAV